MKKTAAGQQAIDISGLEAPTSADSGHVSLSSGDSLTSSEPASLNGLQASLASCSEASVTDGETSNGRSQNSSLELNGNRPDSSIEHNENLDKKLNGTCSEDININGKSNEVIGKFAEDIKVNGKHSEKESVLLEATVSY